MNSGDTAEAVLVTGASRGLGRGIAVELARRGYSVGINYVRNAEAAEETAARCTEAARGEQEFVPLKGDLANRTERAALAAAAFERFGDPPAHGNNAGTAPKDRSDNLQGREHSFRDAAARNLNGPYFLTQAVARRWLERPAAERGPKQVVFVSSISADTVSLNRGEYCVSKAGVAMASQLWAARLSSEGIISLEIRPGIMKTDMTEGVRGKYDALIAEGLVPQKRWGTPEDIGRAVAAVVDGDFAFSPGSVIYSDGGFHISRL